MAWSPCHLAGWGDSLSTQVRQVTSIDVSRVDL